MRAIAFEGDAFEQFADWATADPKVHQKIVKLIRDAARNPFSGRGKPEPLRHQFKGYWSRRITDEHRLVYRVTAEQLIIATCRDHY